MTAPAIVTPSSSISISDHVAMDEAARCRALWFAVLRKAIDDRDWFERLNRKPRTQHTRSDHVREIQMDHGGDPDEFLSGTYCRSICSMINLAAGS